MYIYIRIVDNGARKSLLDTPYSVEWATLYARATNNPLRVLVTPLGSARTHAVTGKHMNTFMNTIIFINIVVNMAYLRIQMEITLCLWAYFT